MDFTVNSKIVAAIQQHSLRLDPVLGTFELVIHLSGMMHGITDGITRTLMIQGARISLKTKLGAPADLGFARPDKAVVLHQFENASPLAFELKLTLQPYQIELIENLRDGGDLNLALKFFTRATSSKSPGYDWEERETEMALHIAESTWTKQLNDAGGSRILLFEIVLPSGSTPKSYHPAQIHLLRAHELMLDGNWRECVSECRQSLEELAREDLSKALDQLRTNSHAMNKAERENGIAATVHHYTHLAAHSESKQGTREYDRADAKMMVALVATLISHHFST